MGNGRIRTFVLNVYDNVQFALWAMLIAGLVVFAVFDAPNLLADLARYDGLRANEIQSEDAFYCRKWGMVPGGKHFEGCMSDLQQFRRSVEKQINQAADF
jgi:hypothetical protein